MRHNFVSPEGLRFRQQMHGSLNALMRTPMIRRQDRNKFKAQRTNKMQGTLAQCKELWSASSKYRKPFVHKVTFFYVLMFHSSNPVFLSAPDVPGPVNLHTAIACAVVGSLRQAAEKLPTLPHVARCLGQQGVPRSVVKSAASAIDLLCHKTQELSGVQLGEEEEDVQELEDEEPYDVHDEKEGQDDVVSFQKHAYKQFSFSST